MTGAAAEGVLSLAEDLVARMQRCVRARARVRVCAGGRGGGGAGQCGLIAYTQRGERMERERGFRSGIGGCLCLFLGRAVCSRPCLSE